MLTGGRAFYAVRTRGPLGHGRAIQKKDRRLEQRRPERPTQQFSTTRRLDPLDRVYNEPEGNAGADALIVVVTWLVLMGTGRALGRLYVGTSSRVTGLARALWRGADDDGMRSRRDDLVAGTSLCTRFQICANRVVVARHLMAPIPSGIGQGTGQDGGHEDDF